MRLFSRIVGRAPLFLAAAVLVVSTQACITGLEVDGLTNVGGSGSGNSSSASSSASNSSSSSSASSSSGESSSSSSSTSSASSASSASSSNSGGMQTCGNLMKEGSEECDDGNVAEGDGCGRDCLVEHPEVCPGAAIHLAPGQTVMVTGTTAGASDKFSGSQTGAPGNCNGVNWMGPDLVYAVTPSANGTLKASLTSTYDNPVIHVRTACMNSSPSDEISCQFSWQVGTVTLPDLAVTSNSTYFVAADGVNNSGSFVMALTLQ